MELDGMSLEVGKRKKPFASLSIKGGSAELLLNNSHGTSVWGSDRKFSGASMGSGCSLLW